MIKIIRENQELDEHRLDQLEAQGLTLISVNHVKGSKLVDDGNGWIDDIKTTSWVYHFHSAAKKSSGPSPYDASAPRRRNRGRTGSFA